MRRIGKFILIIVIILGLSGCTYLSHFLPVPEGSIELETINEITYELVPGTLYIQNDLNIGFENKSSASGSGFIFDEDTNNYYILTNHHVIDKLGLGMQILTVTDYLNNEYNATLLSSDPEYDLAILSIPKIKKDESKNIDEDVILYVFTLEKTNPKEYEVIFSISSPHGQRNAISAGRVVSYIIVTTDNEKQFDFTVIAHSATIDSGSSGSLLINEDFEVVAVNYAIGVVENEDYSLSIPIEQVNKFLNIYYFE